MCVCEGVTDVEQIEVSELSPQNMKMETEKNVDQGITRQREKLGGGGAKCEKKKRLRSVWLRKEREEQLMSV